MGMAISRAVIEAILADARADPDRERCGLLFGDDIVIVGWRSAANVDLDPARRFELDPAELIAAERASRSGGSRLIGHYHSHPDGTPNPSATDAAAAEPDGRLWLIVGARDWRLWRSVAKGAVHGRFDAVECNIVGSPRLASRGRLS